MLSPHVLASVLGQRAAWSQHGIFSVVPQEWLGNRESTKKWMMERKRAASRKLSPGKVEYRNLTREAT